MTRGIFIFLMICFLSIRVFAQTKESYKASIAYKIVESSSKYKQYTKGLYERVVKNGGQSFGLMLESSPNPKADLSQNYSKTYDFNLHESYTDRMPIIARFVFDPVKKQLYEDDVVNATLVPITFDRKLLLLFNKKP
ncbi:hypothetical protein [Pedobacter nototheniae]|uniref:hypothetical protein n=1 Tax=Pedobacter nototheniae TaxID=2488994 RepID=UPI00103E56C3|nr:hypothetical protein [Pedobacter nototheniae]